MVRLGRILAASALLALAAAPALAQQPEVRSDAEVHDAAAPAGQAAAGHSDEHGHGHDNVAHVGHGTASDKPEEFKADLAIYTLIVFLLLMALLWKFAWGPISEGLERREMRIAEQIAAAEKANLDAKAMLAEYERKIAGTADEVRAIIDEARRDAEHTQQEILAKARADAQVEKERGIREIETATNQALKQLAEQSANLAVDLAGKILRAQISPAEHAKLIDESTKKFLEASPSQN
jgi:F-type H+-transporting ATPase subunit b